MDTANNVLPANFAQGLIDSLLEAWGTAQLKSAINLGTDHQISSNLQSEEKDVLYDLLDNAQSSRNLSPSKVIKRSFWSNLFAHSSTHLPLQQPPIVRKSQRDVSYSTLRLIFSGLQYGYSNDTRGIWHLTFNAGRQWWLGKQQSNVSKELRLAYLLSYVGPNKHQSSTVSWELLGKILPEILSELYLHTSIKSNFQTSVEKITIEFPVCPLCTDHSKDCLLFAGVTSDILRWLYGSTLPDNHYEVHWKTEISHNFQILRIPNN